MIDRSLNYGRHIIARFLESSKPYSRVLDIGAGSGTDLLAALNVCPMSSLLAIECFEQAKVSLESKNIITSAVNIENTPFPYPDQYIMLADIIPTMAWGIFFLFEKRKPYYREFLDYPYQQNLETNFYCG